MIAPAAWAEMALQVYPLGVVLYLALGIALIALRSQPGVARGIWADLRCGLIGPAYVALCWAIAAVGFVMSLFLRAAAAAVISAEPFVLGRRHGPSISPNAPQGCGAETAKPENHGSDQ